MTAIIYICVTGDCGGMRIDMGACPICQHDTCRPFEVDFNQSAVVGVTNTGQLRYLGPKPGDAAPVPRSQ